MIISEILVTEDIVGRSRSMQVRIADFEGRREALGEKKEGKKGKGIAGREVKRWLLDVWSD